MLRLFLYVSFSAIFFAPLYLRATSLRPKPMHIVWHSPQFLRTVHNNLVRVAITGRAEPGVKIKIEHGVIAVDVKNLKNIYELSNVELDPSKTEISVGKNGKFEIDLTLPTMNVQVPIMATKNSSQTKQYVLIIDFRKDSVSMAGADTSLSVPRWTFTIAPTLKSFIFNQDGSSLSDQSKSLLLGSTVEGTYDFNPKYLGYVTLSSLQGTGALPSGSTVTFSDFDYMVGLKHRLNVHWIKKVNLSADVNFSIEHSPLYTHDSAGNYDFNVTTLNQLGIGLSGQYSLNYKTTSKADLGFLFGIAQSTKFNSNPNLYGAYLNYGVYRDLIPQLFLTASVSGEYQTFAFSNYDPSVSSSVSSSISQFVVTTMIGLQYQY